MNKRGLAFVAASFCTTFTSFAIRHTYGVLLPEMLPSLAISKTEAGVIYSSYFIAYTVFSPVLGLLGDRINIRVLLTLFPAILGVGAFLMGYSSSLIEASVFFMLAGIGASACWAPVVAVAQRLVNDKWRGTTVAFIDAGASLGVTASGAAMPLIVGAYSWRMGWQGVGTLALLLVATNFVLVRSHPAEKSSLRHPKLGGYASEPLRATYATLLRDIKFWLIGLSYLLLGFSTVIPYTFLSTYAVQEVRLPYELAARLITMMGAASLLGKLGLGSLSDVLGRIRLMMLCGVIVGVGSLGMVYCQRFLTLGLFSLMFGLGQGGTWPLYAACARDYFPKGSTGTVVGFWTLLLGIGSIISPITAGWIADITGTFTWSFILGMATAMIASLLLGYSTMGTINPVSPSSEGTSG